MKKILNACLLFIMSLYLVACQSNSSEFEYMALEGQERLDQVVIIPPQTNFLTMEASEKEVQYQALDKIGVDSKGQHKATDYPHIEAISSESDYLEFVKSTEEQAQIIYIGFDECPWCKVFSPKINQLASEFDLPIYYYNTRSRAEDMTYTKVMESFNVETVPYAFIMVNGELKERINHQSSMQQIEDFFTRYREQY